MRDRVPPQNLEAEQSAIGSLLIDREAHFTFRDLGLTAADFYRQAHELLFEVVSAMHEREETVDLITVQEAMRTSGKLEQVGGMEYICTLIDQTPTAAHARHYGEIVKEKALRRQWIDLAARIESQAFDENTDIMQVSAVAMEGERVLSDRATTGELAWFSELVPTEYQRIEQAWQKSEDLHGISYGLKKLDEITCGMNKGDLIVIAARPSQGKTALALQFAESAAHQGVPTVIFSVEMKRQALAIRALQAASGLNGYALRNPKFGEEGLQSLCRAMGRLSDLPIAVDDASIVRHTDLFPKCRRAVMKHGVGLFILDFGQLVHGPLGESRNREVAVVFESMKDIAKRLDVPFISLSQLSRRCEQESNRRPQLSDLLDSGAIEASADVIMFLHFPDREKEPSIADIVVAKDRQLATGVCPVYWNAPVMRFTARADDRET